MHTPPHDLDADALEPGDDGDRAMPCDALRPRTLALDVGQVRIGVAISCPFGRIGQPLVVISRSTNPFERIVQLIAEHDVATIVVGRPIRMSGEEGPAVRAIEGFVERLRRDVDVPIVWQDERLTTAAAERTMVALGARRRTRREHIDKVAAALILQSYLDAQPA